MSALEGKTVGQLRAMARKAAGITLDRYWDGALPVDVVRIARDLGASVFTAQLGDDTFGMLQSDSAGANIYIDVDQPLVRKRFTCAHEVGHLVSHADEPGARFVDKRSDAGRGTASEIYANEFAGNLLMPEPRVREMHDGGASPIDMAARFGVSLQAMTYRMKVLGID